MKKTLICVAAISTMTASTAAHAWGASKRTSVVGRYVGNCDGFEEWQAMRSMGNGAINWLSGPPCFEL
jgi:hypothetical protein